MIALVLGGARSGKSSVAERLCQGNVTYVATAVIADDDPDLAARVALHRARRPRAWATVEAKPSGVVAAVRGTPPGWTVLIDSLTTWVAGSPDFAVDADGLCSALVGRSSGSDCVVVSDEVGLGVHPSTEVGRVFRDRLGELNRRVADVADRVLLVVAGRVLPLERL
ncbi:MAG: bifunctional adenosylcobinamide kinase/adenosylcobinamide-phosphate guanylyltransferase [Acidimicrobiales bacterium]